MSKTPPPLTQLKRFPADSNVLAAELMPVLESLEQDRQSRLKRISQGWKRIGLTVVISIVVSVVILAIIEALGGPHNDLGILAVFPPVAGLIYCFVVHYQFIAGHAKTYEATYKQQIIGGVTRLLQPGVNYSPDRGISESSFKETGLYSTKIDRYHCEDLFAGKIDKTGIMFSEIHAEEKKRRTNSKGHSTTYWETIFQGLMFIADFNKDFRSWITVRPDFAESTFGWFGRKIQSFNADLVRLENPDFERAFVVHGGDQVEARYILTPDMQERLLSLRQAYGTDIRMSLHHSRLHLTVPKSDDWFEPSMNRAAGDLSQMQTFINQMSWVFSIVEQLDLNTRIWSKH